MKLLEKERKSYISKINDFYKFDFINSSDEIINLFNMLNQQQFNIVNYFVNLNHDHADLIPPIECYSMEEVKKVFSSIEFKEIDNITFNGMTNNNEIYGSVTPRTAVLTITTPIKKNKISGLIK